MRGIRKEERRMRKKTGDGGKGEPSESVGLQDHVYFQLTSEDLHTPGMTKHSSFLQCKEVDVVC